MDRLSPLDARSLLEALEKAGVEFIVVGGLALGAHGHLRATKDLNIVPAPTRDNLQRLASLLATLDYEISGTEDFESEQVVQPDLDGLLGGGNWVLKTKHGRLDILQYLDPDLDYDSLATETIEDEVFGSRVRFCGYRHLVAMKEAAGRPQDQVDLQALRRIREEKEQPPPASLSQVAIRRRGDLGLAAP